MNAKYLPITIANMRSLKAGQTLREKGLYVERTKSGDLRFGVNVMVDGQRIHRVVGLASEGTTLTQARHVIEQRRTEARERRLRLPRGRKTEQRFSQAAVEYLTRLGQTGGRDLKNKRRHIEQRLIPAFGDLLISELSSHDVARYAERRRKIARAATVNRELSTLSHMMNRMVEWGWLSVNDKPKISKSAESAKPIKILSSEESQRLMDAAKADADERLYLFVGFGLNAAMRHSEIVSVRYDQIDFEHRRIFIPQAKAGSREQPITRELADMLLTRREVESDKDGWVFPAVKASKMPHRPDMEGGFRRAVIRANLDPARVTPHIMRHTAITRLVKAGVDLPTVQRISAHKTLSMVLRYTHVHGTHVDEAIAALATT